MPTTSPIPTCITPSVSSSTVISSNVNSPTEEQNTGTTELTTKDSEITNGDSSPVLWTSILIGFISILLIRILKPKFS